MGFLDHSTNNIIIDAVLTDKGRAKLASGDLNIIGYTFGDDEVDYSLIKKYGILVGKEKIEKNTPVFEASTLSDNAILNVLYTDTDGTFTQNIGFDSNNYSTQASASISINAPITETVYFRTTGQWSILFDDEIFSITFGGTSISSGSIQTLAYALPQIVISISLLATAPTWSTSTIRFVRKDNNQTCFLTVTKS